MSQKTSYKPMPPNLAHITFQDRGISLIPGIPRSDGKLRLKMHNEMLENEACHFYADNLYCFCEECRDKWMAHD